MQKLVSGATRTILSAALFTVATANCSAASADVIRKFESLIRVDKDATLAVTENLKIDFEKNKRHGFIRTIPQHASILGKDYGIYLTINQVSCDGKEIKFEKTDSDGKLNLKVGNPGATLTGTHDFALTYSVKGAVHESNGRPEIYWNATGNEWKLPIQDAIATVYPPDGINTSNLKVASFSGPVGSKTAGALSRSPNAVIVESRNLQPGSGLTVAVQLPPDSVKIPGAISETSWWLMQGGLGLGALLATVMGFWPIGLALLACLALVHFSYQSTEWGGNGESSTDFGSSDGGFGGGGGDTW